MNATQKPSQTNLNDCPPDDSLREDYGEARANTNVAQLLVGLQQHHGMLAMGQMWAERANRIGWENAGIDVNRIDKEMADEEVDNSIKMSGDTHIHVQAPEILKDPPQPVPQPQPQTQPTPQPQQPAPQPPSQASRPWLTWAIAALLSSGALGGGMLIGNFFNQPAPIVKPDKTAFDFDTTLPPWMQE